MATGMVLVIITRNIDLSVGSAIALCAVVGASLSTKVGLNAPATVLAMIALGALTGAVKGGLVAWAGVNSFIVTLGMMTVLRGAALAAVALMPIAALSLLYGVLYLNTAAAALATFATLILMRLLVVFPETIQRILLTSHLGIYAQQGDITQPLILLLIYTAGFGLMSIFAFDRRDV